MAEYCAAVDFGTNTARLLIASRTAEGRIEPVRLEREVVRLGGGFTDQTGLSEEAQVRGLGCLQRFAEILAGYPVGTVKASATSAVRDAVNGSAFVDRVFSETGIRLEVIDGETEARLTLRGVLSSLCSDRTSLVILDVGGGSTEFSFSRGGEPLFVRSMPIGVVRLAEGFRDVDLIRARVNSVLDQLEGSLESSGISIAGDIEFVATAGTATTLASIKLAMVEYDYRRVNNATLGLEEIAGIYDMLAGLTPSERLHVKGLEKGREDLIIAGMIIILSVMDRFGFKTLKVSDFGLLEGLALSSCD